MKRELLLKFREIKLFLFDLEGVLLKNADFPDDNSTADFLKQIDSAAAEFEKRNVAMGIVTARERDGLITDLEKIKKCAVLTTTVEKVSTVEYFAEKRMINFANIFYMGDEVLDIPLLKKCGLSAAPKHAERNVKRSVNFTIEDQCVSDLFNELFLLIDKAK